MKAYDDVASGVGGLLRELLVGILLAMVIATSGDAAPEEPLVNPIGTECIRTQNAVQNCTKDLVCCEGDDPARFVKW